MGRADSWEKLVSNRENSRWGISPLPMWEIAHTGTRKCAHSTLFFGFIAPSAQRISDLASAAYYSNLRHGACKSQGWR
jgi:hypothetical protein